jgi:hypothetical protein
MVFDLPHLPSSLSKAFTYLVQRGAQWLAFGKGENNRVIIGYGRAIGQDFQEGPSKVNKLRDFFPCKEKLKTEQIERNME